MYKSFEGIFSIPQDSSLPYKSVSVRLTMTEAQTMWPRIIECFKNDELGGDVEGSSRGLTCDIIQEFAWRE